MFNDVSSEFLASAIVAPSQALPRVAFRPADDEHGSVFVDFRLHTIDESSSRSFVAISFEHEDDKRAFVLVSFEPEDDKWTFFFGFFARSLISDPVPAKIALVSVLLLGPSSPNVNSS